MRLLVIYSNFTSSQYHRLGKKKMKVFGAFLKFHTCEIRLFFLILNVFLDFYLLI